MWGTGRGLWHAVWNAAVGGGNDDGLSERGSSAEGTPGGRSRRDRRPVASPWPCRRCTLVNSGEAITCDACEGSRSSAEAAQHPPEPQAGRQDKRARMDVCGRGGGDEPVLVEIPASSDPLPLPAPRGRLDDDGDRADDFIQADDVPVRVCITCAGARASLADGYQVAAPPELEAAAAAAWAVAAETAATCGPGTSPPQGVCPTCRRPLPDDLLAALAPRAFATYSEAATHALFSGGGFARCPSATCGAITERGPPDAACPTRLQCAACALDFCGSCLVSPYHAGRQCDDHNAHLSRVTCGCGRPAIIAPGSSGGDLKSLRRRVAAAGLDDSWCLEASDVRTVASWANACCDDRPCRELNAARCTKVLDCGHRCGGTRGERACLVACLEPGCPRAGPGANEVCAICLEALRSAPCVRLRCNHLLHVECLKARIRAGSPGPTITFNHLRCPLCLGEGASASASGSRQPPAWGGGVRDAELDSPVLADAMRPQLTLQADVRRAARAWLNATGRHRGAAELQPGGAFEGRPTEFALSIFRFFRCGVCGKPYLGGQADCREQAAAADAETIYVCGGCASAKQGANCPRGHPREYLEWKCRYCCSPGAYFCFGTTHFCASCHAKQNATDHPPHGQEFCLGCALCRHLNTI